jgi:hypothetical protein
VHGNTRWIEEKLVRDIPWIILVFGLF